MHPLLKPLTPKKNFSQRPFDFLVVGRLGLDFYATEKNVPLQAARDFRLSLGGSPGNLAVGLARLGSRVACFSKVAADPFGVYLKTRLAQEGVDTRAVHFDDSGTRTSLAFCELAGAESRTVFYRNRPADLNLTMEDFNAAFLSEVKVVVVSGNNFSKSPSRETMFYLLQQAKQHGCLTFIDLDYRPVSWESARQASVWYQLAVRQLEVVVGTREEFNVLEASLTTNQKAPPSDNASAKALFKHGAQLVVIKHGKQGSKAYPAAGEPFSAKAFRVKALKPMGAGDAYAATLFHGLVAPQSNPDLPTILQRASAAAALVVGRADCSRAMPTAEELDFFLASQKT